jgi:hypothetical protein
MARCIPQTRATKLQQADEHANHHDHQQPQEDPRSGGVRDAVALNRSWSW